MKYLSLFIVLFFVSKSQSQNVFFEDDKLKNAIIANDIDINNDGEISFAEAGNVSELDLDSSEISSLTGLEKFEQLEILDLDFNNLESFPNISLPLLEELYLSNNQLSDINLLSFNKLKKLSLENNSGITTLNLINLASLENLNIKGTSLNVVDLSGLGSLKLLGADLDIDTLKSHSGYIITMNTFWQFGSVNVLDISNHPTQTRLFFPDFANGFDVLIAENCPVLETVEVLNPRLNKISIKNSNSIKTLKTPSLKSPEVLSEIIDGITNIETITMGNTEDNDYTFLNNYNRLSSLKLIFNGVDNFTLSNNSSITVFDISGVNTVILESNESLLSVKGDVKNLKIVECPKFYSLLTDGLEKIEINECENFNNFPMGWSSPNFAYSIKEVSITNCESLSSLRIQWLTSKITKLDVTGSSNLTDLRVSGNDLTSLDLSTNTKLERLECALNPMNNLDILHLSELTYLNCNTTSMDYLDLSFDHQINHLNVNGHDSTFYVCVNDLDSINISTILPSDDSLSMWRECSDIITNTKEEKVINPQRIAVKAYNLNGQEIPLRSINQLMIVLFDDGTYEKTFIYR